jgi:hypothetical protein
MTARRKRKTAGPEEVRLLGLLLSGDIAGFEKATGMSMREMERRMRAAGELGVPEENDEDDEYEYDDEDEDEADWRLRPEWLRPEWLHPDCVNACGALELGTCCKYPVSPLVRRAVDLADSAARISRERLLASVPGLLAQVHAVLPGLDRTAAAQLTCPVGRLATAAEFGPRPESEPLPTLLPLLDACAHALWAALGTGGLERARWVEAPVGCEDARLTASGYSN